MAATLFDTTSVIQGSTPHDHRMRDPKKEYQWESHKGYDLMVRPGTRVYSVSDGEVIKMNPSSTRNGLIYGDRVTVKSADDYIYYTHIESKVRKGQQVKIGDLIGVVVEWQSDPNQTHLHIASERKDVKNYVDFNTWAIVGGAGVEPITPTVTQTPTQQNNNPSPTQGPVSDFYRLLANKTAIPMALAAVPGLSKEEHLQEQIQRIKNLM